MITNTDKPLYCVKCAQPQLLKHGQKAYRCNHCDFTYFHNVAAAVSAFITYQNKILLVERAQQPALGKLDFPGGFVDYAESNELALVRELFEELQLVVTPESFQYLGSYPNRYLYKDVLYSTLDCFFEVPLTSLPKLTLQQEEVSRYVWLDRSSINYEQLAFESSKNALDDFSRTSK